MAGNEFLDKAGLVVLWDRIKQLVYECCCGNKDYECINDEVITTECFEKAVLSVTGGKGGDCGFSCDTRITTLYEGSVVVIEEKDGKQQTRSAGSTPTPSPSSFLTATIPYHGNLVDALRITLNGVECICDGVEGAGGVIGYTDSLSTPTFVVLCKPSLESEGGTWMLGVPSAGTYALKLEDYYDKVETTECFDKAVQSVIGYSCTDENRPIFEAFVETILDKDHDHAFSDEIPLTELSSIPSSLWVDFNNKVPNYISVEGVDIGGAYVYGATFDESTGTFDWSECPFAIMLFQENDGITMILHTEEASEYYLGLGASLPTATVNECFKAAVNEAIDIDTSLGYIPVYYDNDNDSFYSTMSFEDMNKMFKNDTLYAVKFDSASGDSYSVYPLTSGTSHIQTKAAVQESRLRFQHTEVSPSGLGVETEEFVIDLEEETITNNLYKYPPTVGEGV